MPYLYKSLIDPSDDEMTEWGLKGYRIAQMQSINGDNMWVLMECEIGVETARKMRDERLSNKVAETATGIPTGSLPRYVISADDGAQNWEIARTDDLGEAVDLVHERRDQDVSYYIYDRKTGRTPFRLFSVKPMIVRELHKDEPL